MTQWWQYPGLRDFLQDESLNEQELDALKQAASTVRGKRPTTPAEWAEIWNVIKEIVREHLNTKGDEV